MKTGKKVLTLMLACAMVTSTAYMSYSVVDNATVKLHLTAGSTQSIVTVQLQLQVTVKKVEI